MHSARATQCDRTIHITYDLCGRVFNYFSVVFPPFLQVLQLPALNALPSHHTDTHFFSIKSTKEKITGILRDFNIIPLLLYYG